MITAQYCGWKSKKYKVYYSLMITNKSKMWWSKEVTEEGSQLSLVVTGALPRSDYHHKAGRCWGCGHPGHAPSGPRGHWSPGHSWSTAASRECPPAAPAGPPRTYRWTSACSSDACGSAKRRSSRNTTWENNIEYQIIKTTTKQYNLVIQDLSLIRKRSC